MYVDTCSICFCYSRNVFGLPVFICFLAVSFKLTGTNIYYIAMLKHLFLTTFFVFQFESLQSQHEKLEKQAVTVQARLTNLQVCFIVTEVQPNTNA